jgi:hypothetical protein
MLGWVGVLQASMAVSALEAAVDTLIIISNDRLLKGELYLASIVHLDMVCACWDAAFAAATACLACGAPASAARHMR